MIDLEREKPVTLAEAPKLIPAVNAAPGMEAKKPLHPRTLYNWATVGKHGVVLDTLSVGSTLVTTREAIQRFFEALAAARRQRFVERGQEQKRLNRRGTVPRRRNVNATARKRLMENHGI